MSFKSWIIRKLKPELWERFNWEVDRRESLQESCFVVFDTETTGLDLKKDEPISLGALKIEGLRIDLSKSYHTFIKPTVGYGESIKVHGITPQELQGAKSGEEVCREFLSYARGCVLAGYFVHIDVAMIKKLVKKDCGGVFYPPTLELVDLLEEKSGIPTLEELLKKFRLPNTNFHNALEDAYMSALLLLRFLKTGKYSKLGDLPIRF